MPYTAPPLWKLSRSRDAGWSSPVARQAHNLKVTGSNPVPATIRKKAGPLDRPFSRMPHRQATQQKIRGAAKRRAQYEKARPSLTGPFCNPSDLVLRMIGVGVDVLRHLVHLLTGLMHHAAGLLVHAI